MPLIAKIAVSAATYAIDKPYDYLLGEELGAGVGCRVLVPFGRGNRTCEGMVLSVRRGVPDKPLKAVRQALDTEPVLTDKQIRLALWMCQRYFCTLYDAIHTILPAGVWYQYREVWQICDGAAWDDLSEREASVCRFLSEAPRDILALKETFGEEISALLKGLEKRGAVQSHLESKRKIGDKVVQFASLAVDRDEAMAQAAAKQRSSPRQYDVVAFLCRCGETPVHELCYFTGASRQSIKALEKQGILQLRQQEEYRISEKDFTVKAEPITLNDEQQQVLEDLLHRTDRGEAGVTLLQGVTGSGKTLIYIRLAQELLAQGRSVMILVPEIALTPQMMARFSAYFGDEVALLHSGLRMSERYDQYKRIARGEAHIVLGTRSAVFAPLEKLGLIVLDEEQESSYESENAPSYHARDVAKYRCAQEGALLLLGSATPTVETAWHAKNGDYQLALLRKRYNQKGLPRVIMADLRQELRQGNAGMISAPLRQELEKNLAAGEQSILFLNRRGSSRQMLCPECGYVPQCRRCSVYLTYHSANRRMMCHYCGYSEKAADTCPDCGGRMKYVGAGTQKVEQELQELFPDTKILRMDADTVGGGHEALLRQFEEEKIPILLGTQMVAKGLDFDNVTLVGVLTADLSLYVDHYRAPERTFSLLTQVVGRAGRGAKDGRAVIQTYTPENDVIQAAAQQDYERFYAAEIRMRKLRLDPPFADQFIITVSGGEESAVLRAAAQVRDGMAALAAHPRYRSLEWEVLGPAPAPVLKVNNRYRYRITVIGRNDKELREVIASVLRQFAVRSENRNMNIYADCNRMD